jgi:hypothetical protein
VVLSFEVVFMEEFYMLHGTALVQMYGGGRAENGKTQEQRYFYVTGIQIATFRVNSP